MNFDIALITTPEFLLSSLAVLNLLTVCYMAVTLRRSSRERKQINRETFGLLKKVEGLLARKRARIAQDYDQLLEQMTNQVPVLIGKEAAKGIYEAEKGILTRLAEIEPDLQEDADAIHKMEMIIKSLEGLEHSVISSTSKAVENIMLEKRKTLFIAEEDSEPSVLAM